MKTEKEQAAVANRAKQAALKKRRNDAGFFVVADWVHVDDKRALKDFARCLRAQRFGMEGEGK